jgi:murein hydrolase activator
MLASSILFFAICFYGTSLYGEDIFDVAIEYKNEQSRLSELEQQHRQTLGEVYEIERATQKLVQKKTELEEQRAKLNYDLNQASVELVQTENQIRLMTPNLNERMELSGKIDQTPWLYSLLSSQSVVELETFLHISQKISQDQAQELRKFIVLHTDLEQQKKKLTQIAESLHQLKQDLAVEEKKIHANQISKNKKLKRLKAYVKNKKNQLDHLRKIGSQLTQQEEYKDLEILFDNGFFDKKGQLPSPVKGTLVQGFGLNTQLSYDQVKILHKGHFYKTANDSAVAVVAEGRVSYSAPVPGFGQVVIVDHGGRYYTTYANLGSVTVKKGELVSSQQILGKTGVAHLQLGVGLYFEIRYFSEPQDPSHWLQEDYSGLAKI